jgi:hypothetical protein
MTEGQASERRRRKIQDRIKARRLPTSLTGEEPTWIPTPYAVGRGPAMCHYCSEEIGADEALLIRESEQCHSSCEEAWRDLVTGERGGPGG